MNSANKNYYHLEICQTYLWIQNHRDELLTQYPSQLVAIHPEQGVVAAGTNDEDFEEAFAKLDAKTQEESVTLHTSMPL